ncbi:hypothetical protein AB9H17_26570 [Escherichia coli]
MYLASRCISSTLALLRVSNGGGRLLQLSGVFVALLFVGDGVITVMINSPRQADDDADNQSGDNRRLPCSLLTPQTDCTLNLTTSHQAFPLLTATYIQRHS